MNRWWMLGLVLAALSLFAFIAVTPLPPQEALEDTPGYGTWKDTNIILSVDGETAAIRLRHPYESKIVAVLHYRLMSSSVFEVPDGAGGLPPSKP